MKRFLYPSMAALVVFSLFLPVEIRLIKASEFPGNLLYFLLVNLNITALGLLAYLVIKGFRELYTGLKRKTLGFKFRAKILSLFVLLTVIPAVLIYFVASGLAGNYMDAFFNSQFRKPLETSVKLARELYGLEKARALKTAVDRAKNPDKSNSYVENYKFYRIFAMPPDATPAVRTAFLKKEPSVEVISHRNGDLIRAAVPHPDGGVLIANTTLPAELTGYIEEIKGANEGYTKLESWRGPIRANFYMVLGFVALTIMLTALLAALRLAKGITEPVGALARATDEVARGNLNLKVPSMGTDEMGMLIESFNSMVGELREGKESLEHAYQESDRRRLLIEGILENIHTGVICLDRDGKVVTMNPEACRILDIEAGAVRGKFYELVLDAIESDEFKKHIKSINIKTFGFIEREFWVGIGKKRMLLRVFISNIKDSGGGRQGMLVVFDDLTKLARAQRVLAWQEVAKRIAHEIKNPLTPIKLSTERMMKKFAEHHQDFPHIFERSTRTIITEVESLRRLVDEFSRFGKMPEIKKKPSDLLALLDEVHNLYRPYKDFAIRVEAPALMPDVELDKEQFRRALINIIDNAREAMGNAGQVSVKIEPDAGENRVVISISDTGPGIPEDVKEKLFQPYFSTKKDGTGLGLAIVNKIISEHNGYIRVGENVPHGSVFTIEMPIKE